MDPVSTIVIALTAGAASVATDAVKDLYAALKSLIIRRYGSVSVDVLESDPASVSRQQVVREDLEKTNVANDSEILQHAKELLDQVERSDPDAAITVGVSLDRVRAARLMIEQVIAEGGEPTGVELTDVDVVGDLTIRDVQARTASRQPPKA
jgi:hypothetical protein